MNRSLSSLAAALLSLSGLHCGEGAPPPPSASITERTVEPPSPANGFIGSWSMSGSETISFNTSQGVRESTSPVSTSTAIAEGAASDLVFLFAGCPLPANVKGNVASLERGLACTVGTEGGNLSFVIQTGSAARSEDTLQFTASGTVTYVYEGLTYPGTWSWQYTMTKLTRGKP